MRKTLTIFVLIVLLFPTLCLAGPLQQKLREIIAKKNVAGCAASYFEDDFTADDGADAKRAVWTAETDTASNLTIASNKLLFTHDAATVGFVSKTLASTYTETWSQFTWSPSEVAMGGNTAYMNIMYLKDAGDANSVFIRIMNDAAGTITKVLVQYYNDSAVSTEVGQYTFSPSNGTTYTFKLYTKIATDVDTNNGIIELYINGTKRVTATNLDFYTYADIKYVNLGNKYSTWTDVDGHTVTFDNFEIRGDDCF